MHLAQPRSFIIISKFFYKTPFPCRFLEIVRYTLRNDIVVNESPFDEKLAVFSAYMLPLAKYIDNIHNVITPVTA